MNSTRNILFVLLSSVYAASGVAQVDADRPHSAFEPTTRIGCIGVSEVGVSNTAADLAYAARSCAEKSNFGGAAELVLFASAFAFFDTKRVVDRTAHSALNALFAEAIGTLAAPLPASVFAEIDALASSEPRRTNLCRSLKDIGPPNYEPAYMISHGMGAFRDEPEKYSPPAGFDPIAAWEEALVFVECK